LRPFGRVHPSRRVKARAARHGARKSRTLASCRGCKVLCRPKKTQPRCCAARRCDSSRHPDATPAHAHGLRRKDRSARVRSTPSARRRGSRAEAASTNIPPQLLGGRESLADDPAARPRARARPRDARAVPARGRPDGVAFDHPQDGAGPRAGHGGGQPRRGDARRGVPRTRPNVLKIAPRDRPPLDALEEPSSKRFSRVTAVSRRASRNHCRNASAVPHGSGSTRAGTSAQVPPRDGREAET